MYEEIRSPKLLKPIPMQIIRSLSPIYYYSKFRKNSAPQKVQQIFLSNIEYLSTFLILLSKNLKKVALSDLSQEVKDLKSSTQSDLLQKLDSITIRLSNAFEKSQDDVHNAIKDLRQKTIELYKQEVTRIQILMVDNNNEPERVQKVVSTLMNFCYYDVEKTRYPSSEYSEKILPSDFTFFASTHPSHIHDLVKSLHTYKKPGLAIAYIEKDGKVDKQAIRHGAQLQRADFPVLYKVFTPIRLFTSIDKIYMKYNLQF